MIMREASFIAIGIIIASIALGLGAAKMLKEDDSHVEEVAENVIEDSLEELFNLDEGALEDVIDLTPSSPEDDK